MKLQVSQNLLGYKSYLLVEIMLQTEYRNRFNATEKRAEIFYNLYKYNVVNKSDYDSLILSDLNLNYKVQNQNVGQATYFRTVVRNYLISWAKDY